MLPCWQAYMLTCWQADMLRCWHADMLKCWHVDICWHLLTCWHDCKLTWFDMKFFQKSNLKAPLSHGLCRSGCTSYEWKHDLLFKKVLQSWTLEYMEVDCKMVHLKGEFTIGKISPPGCQRTTVFTTEYKLLSTYPHWYSWYIPGIYYTSGILQKNMTCRARKYCRAEHLKRGGRL